MSLSIAKVLEVAEAIATSLGQDLGEVEDQFTELAGARLREDLLDHLDGTVLVVDESGSEDAESVAMVIALGVEDTAALERTLEAVLRKRGLHAGRKTNEYRGQRVHDLNLGLFEASWAFIDGAVLLGVGADGGRSLRKLIDAGEDRKGGVEAGPWSKQVEARLAHAGEDWQWFSISDASGDTEDLGDAIRAELESRIPGAPEAVIELTVGLVELMARFELLTSVTTTRFGRGRIVARQVF
jgi:hypothetical protein